MLIVRKTMEELKPNNTIYINNLNEKIKTDELKKALYAIFSQFGPIVDILCFTSVRMRGQAHLIFKEIGSAVMAVRSMQGFPFHGKPMRIQFARRDSDIIAKAKGTYVEPDPSTRRQYLTKSERRKAMKMAAKKVKERAIADQNNNKNSVPVINTPPNKILFCTNLPEEITEDMLRLLFSQFPLLRDVRLIPGRGIAFVEFEDETASMVAKQSLHNFRIAPDTCINVRYANK
uniref:U2 small nuclear ribonucleoprotein B n=1 Tax=Steinernema glaseri TaxID=37863 RepID=A0A1I7Z0K6_9BILA